MSTSKPTVLESLQLAEQLLQEIKQHKTTNQSKEKTYTLEALGTIWVLIQDKFGNEIQWMSLSAGDIVPVNHNQPLTITCSRGESLKITTADGKPFQVAGINKGITIVRLP